MKKQDLLAWLADHLDNWPKRLGGVPMISGWHWYRNGQNSETVIVLNQDYANPELPEYTITEDEWKTECFKSMTPAEPVPLVKVEAMIDIETFDTTNEALVFQVGIVLFDKDHVITYRQIWNLQFDEQFAAGRTVSASTVAFHLGIPKNAKASLENKYAVTMVEFADQLRVLCKEAKPKQFWAKGSFDFNILESMFKQVGRTVPWKFYQLRELRTLMSECGVKKGAVAHNALEDCVDQVARLVECRGVIGAGKSLFQTHTPGAGIIVPPPQGGLILDPIERHPNNAIKELGDAVEVSITKPAFNSPTEEALNAYKGD